MKSKTAHLTARPTKTAPPARAKPPKLTDPQWCVLAAAMGYGGTIDYFKAAKAGGNGKTLNKLTDMGLMTRTVDRGMKDWQITAAGRAAIFHIQGGKTA